MVIKERILDKIIRISIYALVFLMPLFFLTGSFEWFEFNKFYLLAFLSSLAGILFLFKKIFFRKSFVLSLDLQDFFVLLFLIFSIFSVFFSVDPISSFYGAYQRAGNGFLALISMIVIYFLIKNGKDFDLENRKIIRLFLFSGLVSCVLFYFSVFNVFSKLKFLPDILSRAALGAGSDSLAVLSIYFSLVLCVLISQIAKNAKFELKGAILFLMLILALFILNQNVSWTVIVFTLLLFVFFAIKNKVFSSNINFLLVPIIVLIFSLLMAIPAGNSLVAKLKTPGMPSVPKEQNIGALENWKIGWKGATESITSVLFGSGIGTYSYDYAKYKTSPTNRDSYKTGSYLAEILATTGFFSFLIYIEIFALPLLLWMKNLRNGEKEKEDFSSFIPVALLFISQIFLYQNIILIFYFWLFLAMAKSNRENYIIRKEIEFQSPESGLLANSLMIVSAIIIVSFWYLGARFWIADYNFAKAQGQKDIYQKISLIEKSISLNPNVYHYYVTLASDYWSAFAYDLANQKISERGEIIKRLNRILEVSQKAIKIASNRSLVWQSAGSLYNQISVALNSLGDNQEMSKKTIEAIKSAKELDPKNPYIYLTESQVYVGQKDYDKALESIDQGLKAGGDIILVLQKINILDLASRTKDAFLYAVESSSKYPNNLDIIFQTGKLAYKMGDKKLALQIFNGIINALPNESNSLYFVGVIYEDSQDIPNALKYYKRVLDLNPGNEILQEKIKNLENKIYQIYESESKDK